ncbi:hypothetical protein J1N35_000863 [Gossypium stocksii]|uniref:Transposase MuDR plant domain-containing protein n=1 Tax=Gossypium stocksii TaxID=47602 RepID=A0A9D3WIF9_9ROSI|nr:hypothetical protein J1N35_000863 [Gossypium stocksii]
MFLFERLEWKNKPRVQQHNCMNRFQLNQEIEGSNGKGPGDDEEKDPWFTLYLPHMHNVDLSIDDGVEFAELPHRRSGQTISSLDSGDLEVGKEFSTEDGFIFIVKRYKIKNEVNFYMVKSRSDKFKVKCVIRDSRCAWKIMISIKKKTGLWTTKKFTAPYTYFVTGTALILV